MSDRLLLRAAAGYNGVWGTAAVLAPNRLARQLGFTSTDDGMGFGAPRAWWYGICARVPVVLPAFNDFVWLPGLVRLLR